MNKNLLKRKNTVIVATLAIAIVSATVVACKKTYITNVVATEETTHQIPFSAPGELVNYSKNESLVKTLPGFEYLKVTTLISSDDVLAQSPDFIYGAQPDGAGMMRNPNGEGYIMITNHEILQSVSRVYLDKNLKPIKGEYILNSDGGQTRLCSATLATPEEHGFASTTFLTAGESGTESSFHAIDPLSPGVANSPKTIPAFGKWSAENAVPLPKGAYPGKTAVMIGEDEGDGQLAMYLSSVQGDLNNGRVYVLKRTNNDPVETNMSKGSVYDVEFVEVTNAKASTGSQIQQQTVDKKAIMFARVEDIDYRKGSAANGREIYFTATGVASAQEFPITGKNMFGRVYKLVLDPKNPLKGQLEVAVDGEDGKGKGIVNPDNICVTENFVYIQEDGDSFYKQLDHDGIIWQHAIGSKDQPKPMIQLNHQRNNADFNKKYNTINSTQLGHWEYGAMYDISAITGLPDTFVINLHPHTWQDDKFLNADGGIGRLSNNREGGQTIIVRGIKK